MSSADSSTRKIPLVNLGEIGLGYEGEASHEEWMRVARLLCEALSGVGFVYLTNHGIPEDQVNRLFEFGAAFFALDLPTKRRYLKDSETLHGYITVDQERLNRKTHAHELRESFNVCCDEGMFPDEEVQGFRSVAMGFQDTCIDLSKRLLTALALGLGLEKNFFTSTHCGGRTCLRLLHYPPVPADLPENSTRCGSHTDFGTITLLFQDSLGGLQVLDSQGMWVDASPIPGTILVNVGDLLQFWTANKLKATEHRVLIPKEEQRLRSPRRSVVFFVHPHQEVIIRPIDGSSSYAPITADEYLLQRINATHSY